MRALIFRLFPPPSPSAAASLGRAQVLLLRNSSDSNRSDHHIKRQLRLQQQQQQQQHHRAMSTSSSLHRSLDEQLLPGSSNLPSTSGGAGMPVLSGGWSQWWDSWLGSAAAAPDPFWAAGGALMVTGFIYFYQTRVVCPIHLTCKRGGALDSLLRRSMPVLLERYRPTFWCFESRMQTVFANAARWMIPHIRYDREVVTMPDGGEVTLDWRRKDAGEGAATDAEYSGPIVLFLPGLTGHSQSEYIKSLSNVAHDELGARCVVFNFRGRGSHDLKTPRTYSACNTEDLAEVLEHVARRFPRAPVMAVGVSMGGIMLGNYLIRSGSSARPRLRAAMLLSSCFDTFHGMQSLERPGLNRMLNAHLASCLVESVKRVKHHFEPSKLDSFSADLDRVFSSRTIREFDSSFTAPQFGYPSEREYYEDAKLAGRLGEIAVPTLAMNAEDDPCQPGDSLPLSEAASTDHVALVTTARGGHIGFMEGAIPTRYTLSDRVFAQFSRAVFEDPQMEEILAEEKGGEKEEEEGYITF